jgi:hypothetical protein
LHRTCNRSGELLWQAPARARWGPPLQGRALRGARCAAPRAGCAPWAANSRALAALAVRAARAAQSARLHLALLCRLGLAAPPAAAVGGRLALLGPAVAAAGGGDEGGGGQGRRARQLDELHTRGVVDQGQPELEEGGCSSPRFPNPPPAAAPTCGAPRRGRGCGPGCGCGCGCGCGGGACCGGGRRRAFKEGGSDREGGCAVISEGLACKAPSHLSCSALALAPASLEPHNPPHTCCCASFCAYCRRCGARRPRRRSRPRGGAPPSSSAAGAGAGWGGARGGGGEGVIRAAAGGASRRRGRRAPVQSKKLAVVPSRLRAQNPPPSRCTPQTSPAPPRGRPAGGRGPHAARQPGWAERLLAAAQACGRRHARGASLNCATNPSPAQHNTPRPAPP